MVNGQLRKTGTLPWTALGLAALVVLWASGCVTEPEIPHCVDEDGDGAGDPDFYWDGCDFGVDCDDTDPALNGTDADADGASTCDGDCDDSDASRSIADADGDGLNTCAGDCDDQDPGGGSLADDAD